MTHIHVSTTQKESSSEASSGSGSEAESSEDEESKKKATAKDATKAASKASSESESESASEVQRDCNECHQSHDHRVSTQLPESLHFRLMSKRHPTMHEPPELCVWEIIKALIRISLRLLWICQGTNGFHDSYSPFLTKKNCLYM